MQKLVWNSEPSKNLWCIFSSLIFQIVWLYVVHIFKKKRGRPLMMIFSNCWEVQNRIWYGPNPLSQHSSQKFRSKYYTEFDQACIRLNKETTTISTVKMHQKIPFWGLCLKSFFYSLSFQISNSAKQSLWSSTMKSVDFRGFKTFLTMSGYTKDFLSKSQCNFASSSSSTKLE